MADLSPNAVLALRLASVGLSVFPANPSDKEPAIALSWRKASTTDHTTIRAWWVDNPHAVPAIDCGKSNLVVIDPDKHREDENGVEAFEQLVARNGMIEGVPTIWTPSGGADRYFAQPRGGSSPQQFEGRSSEGKSTFAAMAVTSLLRARRWLMAVAMFRRPTRLS